MMAAMSEALWWFLTPSSLVVVLLLLAYLAARARAARLAGSLLFLPLLLLLVLLVVPLDEYLTARFESRVPPPAELPSDVDGIVVLGGSVEWRITADRGQLTLGDSGERMLAALALARRYPEATLVFTGLYDETLRHEWRDDGGRGLLFYPELSGRRVVFLGEARSTYEEGLLTIDRLKPAPGSNWLLVTSAQHMPRALGTFANLGWKLTPFPVDYRSASRLAWRFEAKVGQRLANLDAFVREWGAYQVYKLDGRLSD